MSVKKKTRVTSLQVGTGIDHMWKGVGVLPFPDDVQEVIQSHCAANIIAVAWRDYVQRKIYRWHRWRMVRDMLRTKGWTTAQPSRITDVLLADFTEMTYLLARV